GEQRGQRARQRVDLVWVEQRAVSEVRLVLGQDALEPQQQRVAPTPLGRGELRPALDLRHRRIERTPAPRPRRKRDRRVLAREHELLAREPADTLKLRRSGNGSGRVGHRRWVSHSRARYFWRRLPRIVDSSRG